jgi:hypothetical protein
MADTLKYGWVTGGRQGTELRLVNSEYFHRLGGAFVCASAGSGHMKIVSAITEEIVGWAEVPRAAVPGLVDFWQSSSTAGNDKVFVIHDPTAVFKMPVAEAAASLSASLVGRYACATWTGSGSTYKQLCDANATTIVTSQMFFVVGVDTDSKTGRCAYVRISPKHGVAS